MDNAMDFRRFLRESEDAAVEESMMSSLKKGLLAGAVALSAAGGVGLPDGDLSGTARADLIPQDRGLQEKLKDKNRYYSAPTMKSLVRLANEGDEWAVREVAWPKGHKFHKMGRPFFRNDGPHPKGLFPNSGF